MSLLELSFKKIFLVLGALSVLNFYVWQGAAGRVSNLEFYFLDVGQGDSQLVNLPAESGEIQILIDGGRGPKVLSELGEALLFGDRYIDLIVATHPDLDHFGGLIDVLKNYQVGAVIMNGQQGKADAYPEFEKIMVEKNIPRIILKEGDAIRYGDFLVQILNPPKLYRDAKQTNENGLVLLVSGRGVRALFTADIGRETELALARKYNLRADILKVAHHGSRFSSSAEFLREVQPKFSVIGVGRNSYGHPTKEVLSRLAKISANIFRTDLNGTVKAELAGDQLFLFSEILK